MGRLLTVPQEVRVAARAALLKQPGDVPEITYRLASGWCWQDDRDQVALWALDNAGQYRPTQCTIPAALRGGRAGRTWALAAAGLEGDIERLLSDSARSDQMLIVQLAAAIRVAWERTMDHAVRKANSRLARSTETRDMAFDGFPNRAVALRAGIDDLLAGAWEAFAIAVAAILADYTRTQVGLVAVLDQFSAGSVRSQIDARTERAVAALVAFMDDRARAFLTGDVPYVPQDFPAARAIAAWVSGMLPAPEGFTFIDLQALGQLAATRLSTAQEALLALASIRLSRTLTWHHGFFGEPMLPFPAHVEADGQTFTVEQVAVAGIFPGDHHGCRCALVPSWNVA